MSTGDTRCSQFAIKKIARSSMPNLIKEKKQRKRKSEGSGRGSVNMHTPDDIFITAKSIHQQNENLIAVKRNQLKDKITRYKSHKDFLTCCIAEKLMPNGL